MNKFRILAFIVGGSGLDNNRRAVVVDERTAQKICDMANSNQDWKHIVYMPLTVALTEAAWHELRGTCKSTKGVWNVYCSKAYDYRKEAVDELNCYERNVFPFTMP